MTQKVGTYIKAAESSLNTNSGYENVFRDTDQKVTSLFTIQHVYFMGPPRVFVYERECKVIVHHNHPPLEYFESPKADIKSYVLGFYGETRCCLDYHRDLSHKPWKENIVAAYKEAAELDSFLLQYIEKNQDKLLS